MADDLAAVVYRYLAEFGPTTMADIVDRLGEDQEGIGDALARLLDAQHIVMTGVTRTGEPLYDVATD